MFGWLFGWLFRPTRNIFRYHDGTRSRAIDPLVAWRRMWEHPTCNPEKDIEPATGLTSDGTPIPFDQAAQDRVIAMARDMFDLKPFNENGTGLTIDETQGLLFQFMLFMNAIKKKRARSPTTSAPTELASSPVKSTISPTSDSISTDNGSKNDAPLSSSKRSVRL